MSPLISEPAAPSALRLVTLGPITLPTLKGEISETVGDQLETVGAGVVAGERRPRPLTLRIPIHGDQLDSDRRAAGLRLRRQLRALLENPLARMQGLYLNWSVDPELNGWLLVGGGDLKYAHGGIVLGDFEVELTDCYRVASRRTHRPARRLELLDRRLATTARDHLGTIHSTDFSGRAARARHFLAAAVTDVESRGAPVVTFTLATKDGPLAWVVDRVDGEVITYEQPEADEARAIVRVYDDHGTSVAADWEPVYGPDQPLSGMPVLDNAVCRVVIASAQGVLELRSWDGAGWVTYAKVLLPITTGSFHAHLVEWTPERTVARITSQAAGASRREIYVTLQRGWSGPRVEAYATTTSGAGAATSVSVFANTAGDATLQRSSGTSAITPGTSIGTFAGLAPWALLLGPGTDPAVHLAVVQEAINLRGAALAGAEGVALEATGYVSVHLATGPRASGATDAALLGEYTLLDTRSVPELVAR